MLPWCTALAFDESRVFTRWPLRAFVQVSTTDRTNEEAVVGVLHSLSDLRAMRDGEEAARVAADAVVLDGLQKSMHILQAQILENFGSLDD